VNYESVLYPAQSNVVPFADKATAEAWRQANSPTRETADKINAEASGKRYEPLLRPEYPIARPVQQAAQAPADETRAPVYAQILKNETPDYYENRAPLADAATVANLSAMINKPIYGTDVIGGEIGSFAEQANKTAQAAEENAIQRQQLGTSMLAGVAPIVNGRIAQQMSQDQNATQYGADALRYEQMIPGLQQKADDLRTQLEHVGNDSQKKAAIAAQYQQAQNDVTQAAAMANKFRTLEARASKMAQGYSDSADNLMNALGLGSVGVEQPSNANGNGASNGVPYDAGSFSVQQAQQRQGGTAPADFEQVNSAQGNGNTFQTGKSSKKPVSGQGIYASLKRQKAGVNSVSDVDATNKLNNIDRKIERQVSDDLASGNALNLFEANRLGMLTAEQKKQAAAFVPNTMQEWIGGVSASNVPGVSALLRQAVTGTMAERKKAMRELNKALSKAPPYSAYNPVGLPAGTKLNLDGNGNLYFVGK
jgi:hypothetical protein